MAVSSEVAEAVEICFCADDGTEERVELRERTAHVRHGHIQGVEPGDRYGLRVHGPWDSGRWLRCNGQQAAPRSGSASGRAARAVQRATVPKTAGGKQLQVRLTIRLGSHSATRVSTFRIG